jgi:hypothetical protein
LLLDPHRIQRAAVIVRPSTLLKLHNFHPERAQNVLVGIGLRVTETNNNQKGIKKGSRSLCNPFQNINLQNKVNVSIW